MPLVPLLVAGLVVAGFTVVGGDADRVPSATPRAAGGAGGAGSGTPTAATPDATPLQRHDPHEESASPVASRTPDASATATKSRTPAVASASASASVAPSASASASPSAPTGQPTRPPSPAPSRQPGPGLGVSFEHLRVGECFDIDRDAPGTAVRRACDTPHDAEVVARPLLPGPYADDRAVRDAATALCRAPLRRKAERQPAGTRWTTFVQYPYRTSHLLGSETAACSLAAPSGAGIRLTRPLQ